MTDEKEVNELAGVIAAGDAWLMKFGVHGVENKVMHNNIVINLRTQFPKIKDLEYWLNQEERKLELTLYVSKWFILLGRKQRLTTNVLMTLYDYLHDYSIEVNLKRFKG